MSNAVLAWCALSLLIAGIVKGISGIGVPLVGISLLALVLPVPQAIALLPIPIIVVNAWQALAGGPFLSVCRRFAPLLLAMCLGTVLGTALLSMIDLATLMLVIGVVVMVFAGVELAKFRLQIPGQHHALVGGGAGLLGGILGGLSSIFGPPILMFVMTLQMNKDEFVHTICCIYLVAGLMLLATLGIFGIANLGTLSGSALASVPLLAGVALGQVLRRRVSEIWFRRILLLMLMIIGVNMIRRGLA